MIEEIGDFENFVEVGEQNLHKIEPQIKALINSLKGEDFIVEEPWGFIFIDYSSQNLHFERVRSEYTKNLSRILHGFIAGTISDDDMNTLTRECQRIIDAQRSMGVNIEVWQNYIDLLKSRKPSEFSPEQLAPIYKEIAGDIAKILSCYCTLDFRQKIELEGMIEFGNFHIHEAGEPPSPKDIELSQKYPKYPFYVVVIIDDSEFILYRILAGHVKQVYASSPHGHVEDIADDAIRITHRFEELKPKIGLWKPGDKVRLSEATVELNRKIGFKSSLKADTVYTVKTSEGIPIELEEIPGIYNAMHFERATL